MKIKYSLHSVLPFFLIILVGVVAYANTFHVPFLFDDVRGIVENPNIRTLSNFGPVHFLDLGPRVLGLFTFAINYRLHGLEVAGYHLVNIGIHLLAALFLYLLAGMLGGRYGENDMQQVRIAPLTAALLFVAHPVQTQAVTYVVQRYASLAGCCFVASLVFYVMARYRMANAVISENWRWCYVISLVTAIIAMLVKETAFTLPFALVLYELMFGADRLRLRIKLLLPFVACLGIIPMLMLRLGAGVESVATAMDHISRIDPLPRIDYLLTQFRVIVTYLQLLIVPVGQNFDYDFPVVTSIFDSETMASCIFIFILLFGSVWLAFIATRSENRLHKLTAFGFLWFFLTLMVESSVIPITDVIFEHRLYIPSIGLAMSAGCGCEWLFFRLRSTRFRWFVPCMIVLLVSALAMATYSRNSLWANPELLLEDNVVKSPRKVRPRIMLALRYIHQGRYDEAMQVLQSARAINIADPDVYMNMGYIHIATGHFTQALESLQMAVSIRPVFPDAWLNLGVTYQKLGQPERALDAYLTAIRQDASCAEALVGAGDIRLKQGDVKEAIALYESAVQIRPELTDAAERLRNLQRGRLQ